jgi:hypothetical protein
LKRKRNLLIKRARKWSPKCLFEKISDMKKYICRERIDEKRTRIKIICKERSVRVGVEHIGVAHSEE